MRYHQIDSRLFKESREKFAAQLKPKSIAIFNSNDILPTNADGTMAFRQSNDIFYLSGIDQEESILVVFPDSYNQKHKEILFLKETSELIEIWEGHKFTKQEARATSGIQCVYWLSDLEKILYPLIHEAENIYLNTNEHNRAQVITETREMRFLNKCQAKYPLHNYERSTLIMHQLRAVKHEVEVELMQQACDITKKAIERAARFIKPGVWEYEIEAELSHEFLRNRSMGFAYTPIIASGRNACVLHYIENNKQCKDGDVILMDVGAEYANYASDLTRCFPVNGRFTQRQKEVYNSVLHVHKEAAKLLRPGVMLDEYHVEVGNLMEAELLKLKLIDKSDIKNQDPDWPAYKKYFMHGTSHFIGLDVHDVGLWHKPIEAGHAFTVEPGIYILEENLGIRLENDFVVTEGGINDLMKNIPLEVDEIEELMNK